MTLDRLKELHHARPFRPFKMHLADGETSTVTHPESLAYSPSGRTIVVVAPDDSTQIVDLLLVSRIEVAGNGRRRSSRRGEDG
jgi:hypothetical protein